MEKCTLRFKKINYKYKEQERPDSAIIQMNEKVLMVTNQHIFCIDRKKVLKNQVDILLCCAKSLQSCPTLCDPMDYSLPGSSVHGILQARILEWVAMPSFRESSQPSNWTHVFCVSCIAGGFFTHWATWEAPNVPLDYPKRNSIWTSTCSSSGINHAPIHTLLSNLFSA